MLLISPVHGHITVTEAWVRAGPTNAKTMAAYATIINHSSVSTELKRITAEGFGEAQIHKTTMKGSMAMMEKLDSLTLLKNQTLELKPGSWHIMLMYPEVVPQQGEIVGFHFFFESEGKAKEISVQATVLKMKIKSDELNMEPNH
ncbi:MAG: copper chaperone PCu(A)C [Candidatus Marinimicrobia bacterium]|nr:copper chaperone PCu(A)C [Candidatus Neomarinimicrobiota bacterium]